MEDYSHYTVRLRKCCDTLNAELLNEFWPMAAETAEEILQLVMNVQLYAHKKMRGE